MFLRKKLITDISSVQIRNVTEILKENNIAYDIKTNSNISYGGRIAEAHLATSYGKNSSNGFNVITHVYVRPRDYAKAKSLLP